MNFPTELITHCNHTMFLDPQMEHTTMNVWEGLESINLYIIAAHTLLGEPLVTQRNEL